MLRRRDSSTSYQGVDNEKYSRTSYSHFETTLPVVRQENTIGVNQCSPKKRLQGVESFFSSTSINASSFLASSPSASSRKQRRKIIWLCYIPAIFIFLAPMLFPHTLKEDITRYQNQIREIQYKQRQLVKRLKAMTKSVQESNTKLHILHKENDKHFQQLHESGSIISRLNIKSEEYEAIAKEEEGLIQRVDMLEKHIQKASATRVLEKFGPGPHRVQLTLRDIRGAISLITLEMAPLKEMPHAVDRFLQMVELNLWEELSFVLGGGESSMDHWMAQPMKMDVRQGHQSWEQQRFEAVNMTELAFTEHSTNYPPVDKFLYSVAFAGHPGGPSFYIRMNDAEASVSNVQEQVSSFARVIEGTDVLDKYWKKYEKQNQGRKTNSKHFELLTIQSTDILS